jgi:hypothetical protein
VAVGAAERKFPARHDDDDDDDDDDDAQTPKEPSYC